MSNWWRFAGRTLSGPATGLGWYSTVTTKRGSDIVAGNNATASHTASRPGFGMGLAVATVVAIQVQPQQGADPDALAHGLVLTIAALVLVRRRWPVAVLLASAAILQAAHKPFDYPGLFPAVPLSVAPGHGLGGRPSGMGASADRLVRWCAGWLCDLPGGPGNPAGAPPARRRPGRGDVRRRAVAGRGGTQPSRSRPGASLAGRRTGQCSEQPLLNVLPAPIAADSRPARM